MFYSGGKSKAKDSKREEKSGSATESLASKRARESSSRLEPLILTDNLATESTDVSVSPLPLPYGYLCYQNMPYSPVDTDPNMSFFPPCRIQYQDYVDGRQQCYSPVSDFGSPHAVFAPPSHIIVPSPPIYVGTPWTVTSPTPQ